MDFCVEAKQFVNVEWKNYTLKFSYPFKTLEEPTYTNLHIIHTGWQVIMDIVQPGRQTSLHSAACRKLKLSNLIICLSFRRHAHIYIPQPPLHPLPWDPSFPPLKDVDNIQGSKEAFPLPTEGRPGPHNSNACPRLWSTAMVPDHAAFSSCFQIAKRTMTLCGEGKSVGPGEKPNPGGRPRTSGLSERGRKRMEKRKQFAVSRKCRTLSKSLFYCMERKECRQSRVKGKQPDHNWSL